METTSRVVPGVGSTIARANPTSALNNRLFPTLGRPAITTFHPASSRSPTPARADQRFETPPGRDRARRQIDWPSRMSSPRRAPVCLIQQDLGGQDRRGAGKVGERITANGSSAECVRRAGSSSALWLRRPARASTTRATAAAPPWHWISTAGGSRVEHNGDHFVAQSVADPAQPQVVRDGPGPARTPRWGRKTASTTSIALGPQTRTTAMAPRPRAVRRLTNAPPRCACASPRRTQPVVDSRRCSLPSRLSIPGVGRPAASPVPTASGPALAL